MHSSQDALLNLWKKIFNQLHEASAYAELLSCSYLSRSKTHLDLKTAERNIELQKRHIYFFRIMESGIAYATVLSITKLFESKERLSILNVINEAKKFKIDVTADFESLGKNHGKTLKQLKTARDEFFAHRRKDLEKTNVPSRDDIFALLHAIAELLKKIGSSMSPGHGHTWDYENEGFARDTRMSFQLMIENLYRGEQARLAEIEIEYSKKL